MKTAGATFILAAMATACSTIPDVGNLGGEPVAVFPVAPDAPDTWVASGVSGEAPSGPWLEQFQDETLEALVSEALSANPSLRSQYFATEAVRAQARSVLGRSRPNVGATTDIGVTSVYIEQLDERSDDPSFGLGLGLNWEIDLWGRIRAGIDAAEADLLVSEADLAGAQLTVASQTAISWIDLNAALAQERVAVQTFEARERALDLTERRLSRGLSTALDVRTARTTLASAEATIALRRQQSKEAARRLEILLGRYPAAEIEAPASLPDLAPLQPGGNPALLLSRRPDVAAAEGRVVAAGLRAEQARLALLPSLTITGSASTTEDDFADAFDPGRIAARLFAGFAAPIFNGGALAAEREAALFSARVSVENYAFTALTAWREVEDAITADALLAQQVDALTIALEEARLAEDLAVRQYTNGLVSIFNLIDSQTRRLNAESQLITAQAQRASNRVQYHLALGGGLPIERPADPIPQDMIQ
ncbi:MAG: efflux transporter outer membrane subunit [Pseudomonadota bacterium]